MQIRSFLGSDVGRSAIALFSGVICFCFPWVPGSHSAGMGSMPVLFDTPV